MRLKKNSEKTPVGTKGKKPGEPIVNQDGSSSSEQTISVTMDGKVYLIPTIVPDEKGFLTKHSNEDAIELFRKGKNPAVGKFDTVEQADKFAGERSSAGGRFSNRKQK